MKVMSVGCAVSYFAMLSLLSAEQLTAWSFIITSITGAIVAIGAIFAAWLNARMKTVKEDLGKAVEVVQSVESKVDNVEAKVIQVEKQGNSINLELKRTISVLARGKAESTKKKSDIAIAVEAEKAYKLAQVANAKL